MEPSLASKECCTPTLAFSVSGIDPCTTSSLSVHGLPLRLARNCNRLDLPQEMDPTETQQTALKRWVKPVGNTRRSVATARGSRAALELTILAA